MNIRIESLDKAENIYQIKEIDQQQLKKQSDQAKRFINSSIKDHPQLESIKGALQVLPHHKLISVLENTQNAINGMGDKVNLAQQDMPELAKPDNETSNSNMYAKAIELLGIVSNLTTNSSLQNQLAQLQSFNATMLGAGAAYSELAELLESQGIQYQTDLDTLNSAQAESSRLGQEAKSAEEGLHNAKQTLTKLEAEAQEQDPVSTELSQQISEAKKAVLTAQVAADKTALVLQQHKMNILNPAITAANNSKLALEKTLEQSRVITSSMSPQQNIVIDNQRKQANEQSKCLVFLIALMSKLIEQRASNDLTAAAELKNKLSEAAAKDAEKKATEYEDNLRKSEEMQKVMGCIGKVLGWVITAVSFAAAAFTGGASLAFASIGLALTLGDEINQAVNGFSFMSEALKPLMEAIIQPMMELLSKGFAQILESLGVDKSIAGMVGQIIGAMATAIIMVAAVVVAGNVASKLASTTMKSFGTKAIDKVMNNVVGDMMKRIGQGLGRSFAMQETNIAKVSTYTNMGLTGASMANTVVQTTGNIITGEMKVNAAKAKADLLNSAALQNLLSEMLNHAVDAFKSRIDSTNEIVKNMAVIADSKMQAGKFITGKISAIAG